MKLQYDEPPDDSGAYFMSSTDNANGRATYAHLALHERQVRPGDSESCGEPKKGSSYTVYSGVSNEAVASASHCDPVTTVLCCIRFAAAWGSFMARSLASCRQLIGATERT